MSDAYICDYIRTPIGRFGGSLASVRADDLGAIPLKAKWAAVSLMSVSAILGLVLLPGWWRVLPAAIVTVVALWMLTRPSA